MDNLSSLQTRIQKASGPIPPVLIAISKQQPDDRIVAALDAGLRQFGENRVQEATERWAMRRRDYPDLTLHLVGSLQSNKADAAVALFDVIHTVDRPSLVTALAAAMRQQGRFPDCLIQVNTGEEAQKGGVLPDDLENLLGLCQQAGLPVRGLMVIPPVNDPAALHFALLARLADRAGLPWRSMGMSDDFETAIRLGATHIRVGSALFGARQSAPQGK